MVFKKNLISIVYINNSALTVKNIKIYINYVLKTKRIQSLKKHTLTFTVRISD